MHRVAGQHAAQRYCTVADRLGEGQQVRSDAEALRSERHADPAEAGDDLVEHQQDAVVVAQFAQALQVARRGQDHPGRTGDGFDEYGGDCRGVMQRDQPLQVVGQFRALARQTLAERIARQVQGVPQVVHAAQLQAERPAVVGQPTQRQAAETDPVVSLLAADEAGALALATLAVIGQRDLHRGIHRLGAGAGEKHVVERARCQCGQPLRQRKGRRRAHLEGRRVVEGACLLDDGLDDAWAGVAGVAAPQAGSAVEDLAAVDVLVVHAFGAYQQARRGLVLAVGGERHPVRVQ